ncbi:MAG: hypothetical protein ACI4JY_07775 [Oscillospiraceae bacterium]
MAVSPAIIKIFATAATDKRTRTIAAAIIAAIFIPTILQILMIGSIVSPMETANNSLLDCSFAGAKIPDNFTVEQRCAVENMRDWLGELDKNIDEKEKDEKCSLDGNLVRAAFYCLNFGDELDEDFDYKTFCECFEGLTVEQLETALQNVSERLPQHEITAYLSCEIAKVYEYLNEKGR